MRKTRIGQIPASHPHIHFFWKHVQQQKQCEKNTQKTHNFQKEKRIRVGA